MKRMNNSAWVVLWDHLSDFNSGSYIIFSSLGFHIGYHILLWQFGVKFKIGVSQRHVGIILKRTRAVIFIKDVVMSDTCRTPIRVLLRHTSSLLISVLYGRQTQMPQGQQQRRWIKFSVHHRGPVNPLKTTLTLRIDLPVERCQTKHAGSKIPMYILIYYKQMNKWTNK